MGTGLSSLFKEYPAEQWCYSWWHKVKYGSKEKTTIVNKHIISFEYFCKKCGKKTDGYTSIHFGNIKLSDN